MVLQATLDELFTSYVASGDHQLSDYFGLIKELLLLKDRADDALIETQVKRVYALIEDEIETNAGVPRAEVNFGTSGWRGILGKDIFISSVLSVTAAIVKLYQLLDESPELAEFLGVASLEEAKERGCLIGHDNRFGGEKMGRAIAHYLSRTGFKVYYCGETTTGVLSASLLELKGAFSINLTPSHNPLEYGGYKYNAADAGPAPAELTRLITSFSREIIRGGGYPDNGDASTKGEIIETDSLPLWQQLVERNSVTHGINYRAVCREAAETDKLIVVIDAVHGASRLHINRLLGKDFQALTILRGNEDVCFGGVAPEPSSVNMSGVVKTLAASDKALKLGAIIDPDGDRIRFTDGATEISMNQFGAMAYHFLHEYKQLNGMVAKTVATSNLANSVAAHLGETTYEPKVGFKEFKPVIGRALVLFEESDGISVIGHTPEKDAYIGLLLALDMVLTTGKNLGDYRREIELHYGAFYPDRDGVEVSLQGAALLRALEQLEKYEVGTIVSIGTETKRIKEVISIDGRKMIFEDDSWIMIRPSGTEPKVRFYVESRDQGGTKDLVATARAMLTEIGV